MVTIRIPASAAYVLARAKAIAAFLGTVIMFATTQVDLPGRDSVWTGAAAILTFVSVYTVPNLKTGARRALTDDEGNPVTS